MTLPTLIIGGGVEHIMWWGVKTLKGFSILNGGRAIIALNKYVPLHTIGLTSSINSN